MTMSITQSNIAAQALIADREQPFDQVELPRLDPTTIYLRNGDAGRADTGGIHYTGGWCISADGITAAEVATPFAATRFAGEAGQIFDVYAAQVAEVAVVGFRESWFSSDDPKQRAPHFKPGYRQHAELLGIVRGIARPVVLSAKGYQATNLLKAYGAAVRATGAALASATRFAPFAFFLPLGPEMADGRPVFRMVGKAAKRAITPVTFRPDGPLTVDWLTAHRTPDDVYQVCMATLPYVAEWKMDRFKIAEGDGTVEVSESF